MKKRQKSSKSTGKLMKKKRLRDTFNKVNDNFTQHKIPLKLARTTSKQQNDKSGDRYVIWDEDFETEYEWIEEKLMTLKQILLSPYSDIISKEAHHLGTSFVKYLQFIDEFFNYQRFVTKAENVVFLNPEFQKDLPNEYKKFNNENTLKGLSKLLKENSHLPKYIELAHDKVLADLKKANKNYEELYKSIEDFLEKRRKDTIKFYFLSNEELLDIFSNLESMEVKKKYIPKMVNGLKSIDMGNETEEQIKILTTDEELITIKYSKGKGNVKDMVEAIEPEISKKIKNSFKAFKKEHLDSLKTKRC